MKREIIRQKLMGEKTVDEHSLDKIIVNIEDEAIGGEYYNSNAKMIVGALWEMDQELKRVTEVADKKYADNAKHLALFKFTIRWMALMQQGKKVEEWLKSHGYMKVVIYGMHYIGERLYDDLENSSVEVIGAIDKNAKQQYKGLMNYSDFNMLPETDAIIVTPITFYEGIKKNLQEYVNVPIISLETIIKELEEG